MSNEDAGWRPGGPSSPGRQDQTGSQSSGRSTIDNAKETLSDAAKSVSDSARDAAQSAKGRAEELAERGKEAGADQIHGFAQAARTAAEDLEKQSPEIAGYVRQAADGLERAASSVRGRSVGEFVDMIDDFARRQPTAFFGSAVLAGFVLSRFVKSRSQRPASSYGQGRSHASAGQVREHSGARDNLAEGLRQTGTDSRHGAGGFARPAGASGSGTETGAGSGGMGQSTSSTPSSIGEMP